MSAAAGNVITFYSYKGGTGRTMALANTGYALAAEGRGDVLMIDWDLEAPGLHNFFPELADERDEYPPRQAGVLELFEDADGIARRGHRLDVETAREFWRTAKARRFIEPTSQGALHLLRAGRLDLSYGERVNAFPWQELFKLWPDLFRAFVEDLAADYRYVLVDSRTGLTDAGGICTSLLPDRLVVVFTPNRQSLVGVAGQVQRAVGHRGRSSDLRPLLVFPLASRVEMSEDKLRQEWRYGNDETPGYQPCFEHLFEQTYDLSECDLEGYFDEVQVQHATSYAYGERIAVRDEESDRLSLSRSYERFTRALVETDGPWTFGRAVRRRVDPGTNQQAEHVLEGIELARTRNAFKASQAKRLDNALIFGALGVVVTGLVIYLGLSIEPSASTPPFTPWIVGTVLIAGLLIGLRNLLALHQRFTIHARTANALSREPTLFEAEAGPYAGREYPVAMLAERLAQIEAEAEDALLDPRGRPTLRFQDHRE